MSQNPKIEDATPPRRSRRRGRRPAKQRPENNAQIASKQKHLNLESSRKERHKPDSAKGNDEVEHDSTPRTHGAPRNEPRSRRDRTKSNERRNGSKTRPQDNVPQMCPDSSPDEPVKPWWEKDSHSETTSKRDRRPDSELVNGDGGLAPPPLDWEIRTAFRSFRQHRDIERWLEKSETAIGEAILHNGRPRVIEIPKDSTFHIAAQYWAPPIIEDLHFKSFWEEFQQARLIEFSDDEEVAKAVPWWDTRRKEVEYLYHYKPPVIAGIDPDESALERGYRIADHGSMHHRTNRARKEHVKREFAKANRKKKAPVRNQDEKIRPRLKIYVRPARPSDIDEIRAIHNYYISSTIATSSEETITAAQGPAYYESINFLRLPLLVAMKRGEKVKGRDSDGETEWIRQADVVVGFAHAHRLTDNPADLAHPTLALKVFIDHLFYMKGIAACLLDRLVTLLDPAFRSRGGYEHDEDADVRDRIDRSYGSLLVNFPWNKPLRLEWMTRWLRTHTGFRIVKRIEPVGRKLDEDVNLAIFQREIEVKTDSKKGA